MEPTNIDPSTIVKKPVIEPTNTHPFIVTYNNYKEKRIEMIDLLRETENANNRKNAYTVLLNYKFLLDNAIKRFKNLKNNPVVYDIIDNEIGKIL